MIFKGIFKNEINNFIKEKTSLGYKYEREIQVMKDFDNYTVKNDLTTNILTKEVVISWIDSHLGVKLITKKHYGDVMREFGKYLNRYDKISFILPGKYYPAKSDFKAYIYSEAELKVFFKAVKQNYSLEKIDKQDMVYLIFKLLYTTGMRVSEVLDIKVKNINFNDQTILLENTKNDMERLIVLKENVFNEINDYCNKYDKTLDDYLFTNHKTNKKFKRCMVYANFRIILKLADITYTNHGPRVHDFRHTFAVHSFKQALNNNVDINVFLPILSTYLGHQDIYATEKYLHLTNELYPEIRKTVEIYDNDIIPNGKAINYAEL